MARSLSEIARDIHANWNNIYFGAVPYLEAMHTLDSIHDRYGYDAADDIVRRFLSNAKTWRGEHARAIKAELMEMIR